MHCVPTVGEEPWCAVATVGSASVAVPGRLAIPCLIEWSRAKRCAKSSFAEGSSLESEQLTKPAIARTAILLLPKGVQKQGMPSYGG